MTTAEAKRTMTPDEYRRWWSGEFRKALAAAQEEKRNGSK